MLEIAVPPSNGNLPSDAELAKYGIFAKRNGYNTWYVYVPLQLLTDPKTGARDAFDGKMLYLPTSRTYNGTSWWGGNHAVRMVWMVQMLVDECQQFDGITCTSYVKDGKDYHNQLQVSQMRTITIFNSPA